MTVAGLCWGGPLEGQMRASGAHKLVALKERPPVQITLREELPPFGPLEEYEYYVREKVFSRLPGPGRTTGFGINLDWLRESLDWRDTDMTKFVVYRDELSWREIYYMVCHAWLYEPERDQQRQRILASIQLIHWLCGALSR